jgi:hypothetical protein
VNSDDAPEGGKSLFERAEMLNSHLQRLIEAIGGPLTASGEVLGRLRRLLGGAGPADGAPPTQSENDDGAAPQPDRPDC